MQVEVAALLSWSILARLISFSAACEPMAEDEKQTGSRSATAQHHYPKTVAIRDTQRSCLHALHNRPAVKLEGSSSVVGLGRQRGIAPGDTASWAVLPRLLPWPG